MILLKVALLFLFNNEKVCKNDKKEYDDEIPCHFIFICIKITIYFRLIIKESDKNLVEFNISY